MRVTARPGYRACRTCQATFSTITADGLSFSLIPRLNATSRIADPKLALDLLLARDPIEASALAAQLEEINRQRREIEAELTRDAMAKVETYDGGRAIVVGGEGWHEGVKGIVASRLTNRYHVPALLFYRGRYSTWLGSLGGQGQPVRSRRALFRPARFAAAGMPVRWALPSRHLSSMSFVDVFPPCCPSFPPRTLDTNGVAATVDLSELNIETIERFPAFSRFCQGNKVPLLAAEGVTMCDRAVVGKTGEHMRFVATDGAASVPAICSCAADR